MKKLLSVVILLFIGSLAFSQITLTENHTAPTCYGYGNGSATITATGGTAPYSYTLSVTQNTTGIFTGLASGTQTVVVEDAALLTATIALTIPVPPQIIPTVTSIPALCFGTATGTINVTGTSGGVAPYQYELNASAYQASSTFSNVFTGVYIVGVKDVNGCIGTQTVQVTEPTQLSSITNANNVRCFGTATGTISVAGIGGTAPYTYLWPTTSSTMAIVPNVPIGIYTVIVTDANGCVTGNSVTVTQPTQLIATVTSQTNASCFGSANGSVNVNATGGGTSLYTYAWSNGSNAPTATNLVAGTYTYIVTDANNCTSSGTVIITQPTQITANTVPTSALCNGACDGSYVTAAMGGTPPYTYSNQLGATAANVPNLCPGSYTITATDANNCIFQSMTTITQPSSITIIMTATNSNCGQANGAVCASVIGGSGITSNLWSNGSTLLCNSNIPAGAYTFTVTDQNGCSAVANGLVNDIGGPNISISSQTNVSCFGGNNGAVSTTVTGGTSPYTYVWTIGGSQSSISGVSAGMYGVTVTDVAGCVGAQSVLINQPQQLTASISNFSNACASNCNGSASVLAMGGTAGYTFSWNTAPPQIGTTLINVCSGSWTCLVTDIKGCIATTSVTISQLPNSTLTINHSNVSCGNPCSGAASASVTSGVIVSFLWQPGLQASAMINNLCAGTYTLNATTNNGCLYTDTVTITNAGMNAIPNASLSTTVIDETCLNTNDGNINLTISGTNPGPFTYQWSNGATTEDVFNIATGSYYVTVYDASLNCLNIVTSVTATGVNCGSIVGNVFIDNNSDCTKNSGDNNSNNTQIIANPGNRIGYTNFNGDYVFYNLPFATYTITSSTNANMIATCVTTLNTTINSGSPNSINNNFIKQYIPVTQPDLVVSAYSNGIIPGFACYVNYYLSNLNNLPATGLFKAVLPSAFIPNITTGNPNTYTISGDTLIWNFNNLTYTGGTNYFTIYFTTPLTTPLGSIFTSCMWAQPTVIDVNYTNNTYCYQRMVTGSYDPNDKTVSPVGIGANGDIAATETDLTYLIRFQNTGNGPAVNIVVKDTLSPNVDINTFEMFGSSHNYMIDVLPGNILRWKFNNIMLADSGSNEPASHGYIQYRIKRNNNNTPGTQIKNTAYIYFDFNEPVVTNTAINTIETITGIKSSFNTNDEWNVYPNPSTGVLYIVNSSSVKEASQIQVVNSIGQTVLEETITNNYKNIDLSKLNNGVYFVKILSDKQSVIKRVVLSR